MTCNSSGGKAAVVCRQHSAPLFSCPGSTFVCSWNSAASLGIFHWKMDACRSISTPARASLLAPALRAAWRSAKRTCWEQRWERRDCLLLTACSAQHMWAWCAQWAAGYLWRWEVMQHRQHTCFGVCVKRDFVARSASNSQCTYTVPQLSYTESLFPLLIYNERTVHSYDCRI